MRDHRHQGSCPWMGPCHQRDDRKWLLQRHACGCLAGWKRRTCMWSMSLDVPTRACGSFVQPQHACEAGRLKAGALHKGSLGWKLTCRAVGLSIASKRCRRCSGQGARTAGGPNSTAAPQAAQEWGSLGRTRSWKSARAAIRRLRKSSSAATASTSQRLLRFERLAAGESGKVSVVRKEMKDPRKALASEG